MECLDVRRDNLFANFDIKIVGRARDSLGTFLKENNYIENKRPKLNVMMQNGFVF